MTGTREPELATLRKLAEDLAKSRSERVTTGHLLAAIASQTRSLAIHESEVALKARINAELRLCLSAQATADLQRLHQIDPSTNQ